MAEDLTHLLRQPIDAPSGSPLWWLDRLERELVGRQRLIQLYEDYYEGRHVLAFATSKFRQVFGEMLAAVSDPWMSLVVRASVERLSVQGFRLGDATDGDPMAWDIWQRNGLDLDSSLAFTEAVKHGESYLLTWWGRNGEPEITVEHPSQMIVAREAGNRRRRAAALKRWMEDDGTLLATVYLPDTIHRFELPENAQQWRLRSESRGAVAEERNPLRVVPVVPLVNEPHMLPCYPPQSLLSYPHRVPRAAVGLGRSDLADAVPTQDQINKLLCDMMVASEVGAFRQRWATGLEVPEDENGDPVQPFEHAIDRLWTSASTETTFGEFTATDLANFTKAIEGRIQSLGSRTRTPPHYMLGQSGSFPSGESLRAAETGLVAKAHDKQRSQGEGLEEAMGLALTIKGHQGATHRAEVDWEQAEYRSESEFVDSLVKKLSIGVPVKQLWRDAGYSAQQIAEFRSMLKEYGFGATPQQPYPQQPEPEEVSTDGE